MAQGCPKESFWHRENALSSWWHCRPYLVPACAGVVPLLSAAPSSSPFPSVPLGVPYPSPFPSPSPSSCLCGLPGGPRWSFCAMFVFRSKLSLNNCSMQLLATILSKLSNKHENRLPRCHVRRNPAKVRWNLFVWSMPSPRTPADLPNVSLNYKKNVVWKTKEFLMLL